MTANAGDAEGEEAAEAEEVDDVEQLEEDAWTVRICYPTLDIDAQLLKSKVGHQLVGVLRGNLLCLMMMLLEVCC